MNIHIPSDGPYEEPDAARFLDLREEDFGNEDSDDEYGADSRAPKLSDVEKAVSVLNFGNISNVTNSYLGRGGAVHLLKVGVMQHWQFDDDSTVKNWIVEKAAAICAQKASFLTDQASWGPYFPAAMTLKISYFKYVDCFTGTNLDHFYAVKHAKPRDKPPYSYELTVTLAAAVRSISRDAVSLAIKVANDLRHLILLPNDNFNWVGKVWEGSASHGDVVHDQVSALLVALPLPAGTSETEVQRLGSADNFARTAGTRHKISPEKSLEQIHPDAADYTLVLRGAMVILDISSSEKLYEQQLPSMAFKTLCGRIISEFLIPSIDRLEALKVKKIRGNSRSGNAVLLMFHLMTIREM
ncbi:hypothetical protein K438DRAFT_1772684 [Mycena galopus ATCC 62051]|nr:hypothetical protein K438DRAFT_1772684 [Mycena galopus ATCC 62051]